MPVFLNFQYLNDFLMQVIFSEVTFLWATFGFVAKIPAL